MEEKISFSPVARNNRDEAGAFTDTRAFLLFSLFFSLKLHSLLECCHVCKIKYRIKYLKKNRLISMEYPSNYSKKIRTMQKKYSLILSFRCTFKAKYKSLFTRKISFHKFEINVLRASFYPRKYDSF